MVALVPSCVDALPSALDVPLKRWAGERLGPEGASVYTRDPDANLLEFIVYDEGSAAD